MSWRKYLLLPRVAPAILGRTPEPDVAWEAYWHHVRRTGPDGEVLWDGAGEEELRWWLDTAREYLDLTLPVLDVACGNGRLSRLLAAEFPAVMGMDHSQAALDHAERESLGTRNVSFRRLDVTTPGIGAALVAELGAANVVVRGLFHILDSEHRRRVAVNLAQIIDGRGHCCCSRPTGPETCWSTWSTWAAATEGCPIRSRASSTTVSRRRPRSGRHSWLRPSRSQSGRR